MFKRNIRFSLPVCPSLIPFLLLRLQLLLLRLRPFPLCPTTSLLLLQEEQRLHIQLPLHHIRVHLPLHSNPPSTEGSTFVNSLSLSFKTHVKKFHVRLNRYLLEGRGSCFPPSYTTGVRPVHCLRIPVLVHASTAGSDITCLGEAKREKERLRKQNPTNLSSLSLKLQGRGKCWWWWDTLPAYCLMAGLDQPPKGWKSLKEATLS